MRTPRASTVRWTAAFLWTAAGVGYLAVEAVTAAHVPDYSYARDYVSDLGRPASDLAWWMNAAFRLQGLAFVVAGALAVWATRPRRGGLAFVVFACMYGAGSVVVGLFPSGGSGMWQVLHAAGATAAIIGGNLAAGTAGWAGVPDDSQASRVAGYGLGALGVLSAVLLVNTELPTGLFERGAIYSIIAWQLAAAWTVGVSTDRAGGRRAGGRAR
ncbi:DUF998 domain-containing protein [Mycolicibacterium psychrotolerans]|uniref:DUF998 domain-containing protein n=1 Tax=Mycolicibacterium psychrotolerans TaxID=216929 RepID=UPI0013CF97A2|nr:DUF998 domain-containing protein [Mycolicibacterium psychrotolerans]